MNGLNGALKNGWKLLKFSHMDFWFRSP